MTAQTATLWLDDWTAPLVTPEYTTLDIDPEQLPKRTASIIFLDRKTTALGKAKIVPVPDPIWMETVGADGALGWSLIQPPLSFDFPEIPDAEQMLVSIGPFKRLFMFDELAVSKEREPDQTEILGNGQWTLALMSEMFEDWPAFREACLSFDTYLRTKPPFNSHAFRTVMLFWKSDERGLFDTQKLGDRRIFGDNRKAAKFLKKAGTASNKAVVLINHPDRGGAGGLGDRAPAWASIAHKQVSAVERWEDVALHELGHAFGLVDEYDTPWSGAPSHDQDKEPNVTRVCDALSEDCPWHLQATAGMTHDPTWATSGNPPSSLDTVVGTFMGARYSSTEFYRPAARCRMRSPPDEFCAVCQKVIAVALSAS